MDMSVQVRPGGGSSANVGEEQALYCHRFQGKECHGYRQEQLERKGELLGTHICPKGGKLEKQDRCIDGVFAGTQGVAGCFLMWNTKWRARSRQT